MRILLLAPQPFFQNRGTPIAVRMLAEVLQEDGHSVELLVFHEGDEVDLGGVILHRITAPPGIRNIRPGFSLKKVLCDVFMLIKAIRLCKKQRYDVVHAVEEAVFIAMLTKFLFKIPYIWDIDSWLSDQLIEKYGNLKYFKKIFGIFEKSAVRQSTGAVAVCKELEEKVKQIDNQKPLLRLEDVSLLEDEYTVDESLRELVRHEGQILLYVGNLEKYQGIDFLLESFKELLKRKSDVNLIIIGGTTESIKNYTQLAEELAIDSRVFFIGPRPVELLGGYLSQADILVSPRIEGVNTPMKIYSYMGSGIPLVATRIKSHTQVLDDNTAFLADPDPEKMAEVLNKAIINQDLAQKVAYAARKLVDKEYSRSAFKNKLTGFYSELSHVWNMRF